MYFSGTSASCLAGGACRSGVQRTHATSMDVPTGRSDGLRAANLDDQKSLEHRVMVSVPVTCQNEQRCGGISRGWHHQINQHACGTAPPLYQLVPLLFLMHS